VELLLVDGFDGIEDEDTLRALLVVLTVVGSDEKRRLRMEFTLVIFTMRKLPLARWVQRNSVRL